MDINPRVLRAQVGQWLGKKVVIGTTGLHYVSGVVQTLEGADLKLSVNGEPVIVPMSVVASITEAPALQAEYVK